MRIDQAGGVDRGRFERALQDLPPVAKQALLRQVAHHPARAREILEQTLGFAVPAEVALPWSTNNVVAIADDVLKVRSAPGGADGCHQALLRNAGPAFAKVSQTIADLLAKDGGQPPSKRTQTELRRQFTRLTALADTMTKAEADDASAELGQVFDTLASRQVQGFVPATQTLSRSLFGQKFEAKVNVTPRARMLALYVDAIALGTNDGRLLDPIRGQPLAPTGHDDTTDLGSDDAPFGFGHPPDDPKWVLVPSETTIDADDTKSGLAFGSKIQGVGHFFPLKFDIGTGEAFLKDGRYHIDLGGSDRIEIDLRDMSLTHHGPNGPTTESIADGFADTGMFQFRAASGRKVVMQRFESEGAEHHVLAVQVPGGAYQGVDFTDGCVFRQKGDTRTIMEEA